MPAPQAAAATRRGTRPYNADAARTWTTDKTTVATVVDGIGNSAEVAASSRLLAGVIARVAAHRGGLAALLTAADLLRAPAVDGENPDAVAVAAVAHDDVTAVHWIGDARAYGWDGRRLRRYTTDQTVGEQLRRNGAPWDLAADHDNWVRATLRTAVIAAVYDVEIPADETVLLVSDGVPDGVPHDELEALLRRYDEPQDEDGEAVGLPALARGIIAAAREDETGYRDDATVVVLRPAAARGAVLRDRPTR
ncbi:PP2C family protein-serine/threonine phosphatase [Actinomadura sp. 3N508]|uniref:PP2C family protein-serine/threonine phosphatase n=1 Tax=Actinomadura sp. 3N508 TaxID=3375153 RepID=UPI0037A986D5